MGDRFETQDKLIAAPRHILIYEGVEGFTLDNVCTKAGFSRGAFYSNFSTKDALLAAMAEDEYAALIDRLYDKVQQWRDDEAGTPKPSVAMEDLLYDALDAIGINRSLYVLHSELLTRSVRNAEWGAQLMGLNNEFIAALNSVLEEILKAANRQPTRPIRALTHSVIGIVLRAAGLDSLRMTAKYRIETIAASKLNASLVQINAQEVPESESVADSPARDIVEMVLLLLYAASEPLDPQD